MLCKKCNAPLESNDTVCSVCGEPVYSNQTECQKNNFNPQAEYLGQNIVAAEKSQTAQQNNKKIVAWVSVGVCVAIVIGILLYVFLGNHKNLNDNPINTTIVTQESTTEPNGVQTYGNSMQNVANGGLSVSDGEYIFFAVRNIDYSKDVNQQNDASKVYRMKADGSERTPVLTADAISLNLMNGSLYYSDLKNNTFCKSDYNGGNIQIISQQALHNALVTDKYIYYIDTEQYSLRRMDIDGANDQKLIEDSVDYYFIFSDEIYYKINQTDSFMNKCDIDGKNPKRLDYNATGLPVITQDNIYCNNGINMVYKISADGFDEVMLYSGQANGGLSLDNDYIYFSNISTDKSEIMRVKTDGTGIQTICTEKGAKYITISGDYLFGMDDDEYCFALKTDGSGYELLSDKRNMESDEYFKTLLKKNNSEIKDNEILTLDCMDFDGDGDKEAYAFVGRFNESENYYNGELWFITKEKVVKATEKQKYSKLCELFTFGKKSCVVLETYDASQNTVSYVYGAEGGDVAELRISGQGNNLTVDSDGTLLIYVTEYDALVNNSGKTVKPYYYFYNGDNFYEYGGLEMSMTELKDINGGLKIIQDITIKDKRITKIYYRANGIININATDGEWQEYYNARMIAGTLTVVEKGDGEYLASHTPKFAVTPEEVALTNSSVELFVKPQ